MIGHRVLQSHDHPVTLDLQYALFVFKVQYIRIEGESRHCLRSRLGATDVVITQSRICHTAPARYEMHARSVLAGKICSIYKKLELQVGRSCILIPAFVERRLTIPLIPDSLSHRNLIVYRLANAIYTGESG